MPHEDVIPPTIAVVGHAGRRRASHAHVLGRTEPKDFVNTTRTRRRRGMKITSFFSAKKQPGTEDASEDTTRGR